MKSVNSRAARLPLDPLLLGLYAWVSTVAVPAFSGDAPPVCRWLSCAAFLSLVLAWIHSRRWKRLADGILVVGYIGFSFSTWATLGHTLLVSNLAELRAVIGAIAWGLFVAAWIRSRQGLRGPVAQVLPEVATGRAAGLTRSGYLHLVPVVLMVLSVFLGLGLPSGTGRGAFATAIALGWSIGMIDTSGLLAARLEQHHKGLGYKLFVQPSMVLAVGLTLAGVIAGRFATP